MAKIDTSISEIHLLNGIELSQYRNRNLRNKESELIVVDDTLYKIIDEFYRKKRRPIMEFLHDTKHGLPIDLKDLLYENGKFFAYTMQFYKNYDELHAMLVSDASLEERKKVALELVDIFEKILNLNLVYYDWHSRNIVINQDLKLLDIDSAQRDVSVEYCTKAIKNLLDLCISLLIGIDFNDSYGIYWEWQKQQIYEKILLENQNWKDKYKPISLDYIRKEINSYTLTKQEYAKEVIVKHIKTR